MAMQILIFAKFSHPCPIQWIRGGDAFEYVVSKTRLLGLLSSENPMILGSTIWRYDNVFRRFSQNFLTHPIHRVHWGWPLRVFGHVWVFWNYNPGAIVWWKPRDPTINRFDTIPACDRQTDRQTDFHAYYVLLTRVKTSLKRPKFHFIFEWQIRYRTNSGKL